MTMNTAIDAGEDLDTGPPRSHTRPMVLHNAVGTRTAPRNSLISTLRGRALQVQADIIATLLALAITQRLAKHDYYAANGLRIWFVAPLIFVGVFAQLRLYSARTVGLALNEFRRVVYGAAFSALLIGYVLAIGAARTPREDMILAANAIVLLTIERRATRRYFSWRRGRGLGARRTVLVGTGKDCDDLSDLINANPELGYRVVARTLLVGHNADRNVRAVVNAVRQSDATDVLLAEHALDGDTTKPLARVLHDAGIRLEVSSGLVGIDASRITLSMIGGRPVLHLEGAVQRGWRAFAKRGFDITVSTVALALLAPTFAVAAFAIWLNDRGPVLFRQQRLGKDGEFFNMIKLRTMVPDAEARLTSLRAAHPDSGPLFKMKHDPRITRPGRIFRKLSIDEIPQFWNVLKGEMSLVGPRPALPAEAATWEQQVAERLRVKPGITGIWQVSGRSDASFEDYVRLDLYYVDNWNLLYDLAILAKTLPAVLRSSGAY